MAREAKGLSPGHSFAGVTLSWQRWWRDSVLGTVDQAEVIAKRREDCAISPRYLFMTAMSGGIAILGLLLASPAVVIGAMLLSPLMGPIIGSGFALATGDFRWLRQAARSLLAGSVLAVLLCALIVVASPLQTVTTEIAARTRPNLFDLLVALFSALAGAYAMIRGKEGTIVGVAIATALMPPLAVIGFGLATLNWTVFSGALLLYVTNLAAIGLTAAVMARIYGFRTTLSPTQTHIQTLLIVVALVGLAVPLGYSLLRIAFEANAARQIRTEILDDFDNRARLSQVDIDWNAKPIAIDATVLTPAIDPTAEARGERALSRTLGQPVDLAITQYKVGTSAQAAEAAQLSAASAREEAAASERARQLAQNLALAAGVNEDEVLIDRQHRRAMVRAKQLPGADIATYAALERRIAKSAPEWRIELIAPPSRLPPIEFEANSTARDETESAVRPFLGTTDAGTQALALGRWAALRSGLALSLSGPSELVERAKADLERDGIVVRPGTLTRRGLIVTARLVSPDEEP